MTTIMIGSARIRVPDYVHVADDVNHHRISPVEGEHWHDIITITHPETQELNLDWEDGDVWITLSTWEAPE